ncbi:MAG TPA: hypothetical protein VF481_13175 [Novosphingobium sp.]
MTDQTLEAQSQADRLVALVDQDNPFDIPFSELLPQQIEAINERFQDRVGQIKLLQNRAEEGGITEIRRMEDIVPLLFAHTAYKSYPEGWLIDRKWDRMGKWLDTVSTHRVKPVDPAAVSGLDSWLELLMDQGHFVGCSSGTTGKCAMMNGTTFDMEFSGHALLQAQIWAGLAPNHDRKIIAVGMTASTPKNNATGAPMVEAFTDPAAPPFAPNVPKITIGSIVDMVVLRKKIADGTALPADLEYYEEQSKIRAAAMDSAVEQTAQAFIDNRDRKLHIMGLFGPFYQVAEMVRERGYSAKDFAENTMFSSGGLKRAQVPENYKQIVFDTFNITPERICHTYGMQEINTTAPRCSANRYHIAPWVMLLVLDESGENLIPPPATGEAEGRAAFFDLSMDGRWGGVISGDKIRATWEPCACGNSSPSVHEDIQRYADLAEGDKIACSGTIDAYVRGVS